MLLILFGSFTFLKCNNGDYYKGCTNDLDNRLAKHQQGKVPSTCENLPLELVTYIAFTNKDQAFRFEKIFEKRIGKSFFEEKISLIEIQSAFAELVIV